MPTGTSSIVTGAATVAGLGTLTDQSEQTYKGTSAASIGSVVVAASGQYNESISFATSAATIGVPVVAGTGTYQVDVDTGTAAIVLSAITATSIGTFDGSSGTTVVDIERSLEINRNLSFSPANVS